jgi:hypothetical protein
MSNGKLGVVRRLAIVVATDGELCGEACDYLQRAQHATGCAAFGSFVRRDGPRAFRLLPCLALQGASDLEDAKHGRGG